MQEISQNTNKLVKFLAPYRQWVVHRADKVPLNPHTGERAASDNPATWGTFEEAVAALHRNVGVGLGLGFVLTNDDPFAVIDLDDPTDPKRKLTPEEIAEAQAFQQRIEPQFDTYKERSPSGKGLHIWCKGTVPTGKNNRKRCVEVYSTGRYMTVTGDAFTDKPIQNCNLHNLWEELGGVTQAMPTVVASQPTTISDQDLCNKAAQGNNGNGQLFIELWNGRWQQYREYPSQSEADIALVNIIAFYTDDAEQVARLFRASALGQRPKAMRNDYLFHKTWGIITKAFDRKGPMLPAESLAAIQANWPAQVQNIPFPSSVQVPTKRKVEVTSMDNIQPEKITWLWQHWLALGKFSLIAGGPGIGKSQMTLAFAATVSNGGMWPDGTTAKQGRVVVWSGEDGVADTIAPRLWAAGARLDQIYTITATIDDKGNKLPFSAARDLPLLIETIELLGDVVLVIIDPIVSLIQKDMNQTNVVRNGLQPLVDMGNKLGFCTLGITHFRKGSEGQEPIDRILGSSAFGALPRTVLVAAKDNFSERRVLALAKGNIGNDTGGYEYTIESATIRSDIPTSKVVWGCALTGSARDILASVETPVEAEQPSTKIEEAKRFLETHLNNGMEVTAIELVNKAGVFGISSRTLQRAKTELGIVDYKSFGGPSMWRFPLKFDNNINSTAPRGT